MTCTRPLQGWQWERDGETVTVVGRSRHAHDVHVPLPCGQCPGCLAKRRSQWGIRAMHEAQCHDANSFVTLTYSDEYLPDGLVLEHLQDFMRELRRKRKVRYLACGEYGEKTQRPHYHACLFGVDFADSRLELGDSPGGHQMYQSAEVQRLWPLGLHTVQDLTYASAAYVAGYTMKSISKEALEGRRPPFLTMSRRPGIGAKWFERYHKDVFPNDFCVNDSGKQVPVPRYYDKLMERMDPEAMAEVSAERVRSAQLAASSEDRSPARMKVRERVRARARGLAGHSRDQL